MPQPLFKSYLGQGEDRADWQEDSNILISEFLCKTVFITKANLSYMQKFYSSSVLLLGRKHKTTLENEVLLSSFICCLVWVRKCHVEKRASCKGCSISLPHHLFIPLRYTPDLQAAHLRAWERDMQHDIRPLQVVHDFSFRYARLPPCLRGSSTVPTSLI